MVARLCYQQTKVDGAPMTILVGADVVQIIREQQEWVRERWNRGLPLRSTADRAKRMAAIRVQLVKDILHLHDGTVRLAAWGLRPSDHSISGESRQAGDHSGSPARSRVRGAAEIAATRPSGSSAPWSSKTSAPLHSKVQPWPGCSAMLRAAHQSIASAAGQAGSWAHMTAARAR
jgi:hypothetical protein